MLANLKTAKVVFHYLIPNIWLRFLAILLSNAIWANFRCHVSSIIQTPIEKFSMAGCQKFLYEYLTCGWNLASEREATKVVQKIAVLVWLVNVFSKLRLTNSHFFNQFHFDEFILLNFICEHKNKKKINNHSNKISTLHDGQNCFFRLSVSLRIFFPFLIAREKYSKNVFTFSENFLRWRAKKIQAIQTSGTPTIFSKVGKCHTLSV